MEKVAKLVTGKRYIELTGIKPATFYRYVKEGKLPYFVMEGKEKRKWFDPSTIPDDQPAPTQVSNLDNKTTGV